MIRLVALLFGLLCIRAGDAATYTNPILTQDFSDPDVIRVGKDFYMTASSFNMLPGLPVLHSRDLVHWRIISHAIQRLPDARHVSKRREAETFSYDDPRPGRGVYAPCIRYHDDRFWIFWADPDGGVYQVTAKDPHGPWSAPVLVWDHVGIIDPSPLWDEETGKAYLSFAYAKSRMGFNSRIDVIEMRYDGTGVIGEPVEVFAADLERYPADRRHSVIEGTKFMKRNGWYYILCPAGGVEYGWQASLRSRNPFGPYEIRTVLETGDTDVNGPHQGGLFDTPNGDWWFIHFQATGTLGRIVHLQPARWVDDWPVMGLDPDGDGIGNPVKSHQAPLPFDEVGLQRDDDFSGNKLGLQWQWPANPQAGWINLKDGFLEMPVQQAREARLNELPAVLTQMFPGVEFTATVKMDIGPNGPEARAGIATLGKRSFDMGVTRSGRENTLSVRFETTELASVTVPSESGDLWLRLETTGVLPEPLKPADRTFEAGAPLWRKDRVVDTNGIIMGQFSYSLDGTSFQPLGPEFEVREGEWIGARLGLFNVSASANATGFARFDSVEFELP